MLYIAKQNTIWLFVFKCFITSKQFQQSK